MDSNEVTAMRDNTKATLAEIAAKESWSAEPAVEQVLATWTTNLLLCELWLKVHKQWGGE
jgi:hypothetical protein